MTWTSVVLFAALTAAPAQAGKLALTNVRLTNGILGPVRTDAKLLPGDSLFVFYDIDGLAFDSEGVPGAPAVQRQGHPRRYHRGCPRRPVQATPERRADRLPQVQGPDGWRRQRRHRDRASGLSLLRFPGPAACRKTAGKTSKRQGGDQHAVAEPLACHESRIPALTNEFDDHESRKGIANVFWNQRSLVGQKAVQAKPAECRRQT